MKNTPCLFDDKQTPEGMVSVSQLQTFLSCKKKWAYGYIENLTPKVERPYFTIGKLCHKGMQVAMHVHWRFPDKGFDDLLACAIEAVYKEWESYISTVPLLDEEMPDIAKTYEDACAVFEQALREFEPDKYEVVTLYKKGKPVPALELHFRVPCPPTKGLHGYIDAILKDKETGFVWCTDYKFRKSLSPDEDEAYNIQNAVYAYACQRMKIGITGTMTWQHVNTPAADPTILKNSTISRAKIRTTWKHYEQFCREHGQDPQDYFTEMEEKLRDIEWFRPTYEYRNSETVQRIWKECVIPAAKATKSAHGVKADNFRSLYPWNCKMCQFQSICQAELRDHDAEFIRQTEYVKRDHPARQPEEQEDA
jgi:hypothetical protein